MKSFSLESQSFDTSGRDSDYCEQYDDDPQGCANDPLCESEDDDGLNVIGAEPGEMPVTGLTQPGQIVGPSGGIDPKADNDIGSVHPSVAGHSSNDDV